MTLILFPFSFSSFAQQDTAIMSRTNDKIDVKWFGAKGDGHSDDWSSIQKAITYILDHNDAPRTLYFPPGTYSISRPLIIARFTGNSYKQASISLTGPANSKTISTGYAALAPTFNNTFAIGIQLGKGVLIKDLVITGRFTFPNSLNPIQVDTLAFKEWKDGSSRDNRRSPYAGIVIDPFSDSAVYERKEDMYPGLHRYYCPGLNRGGSTSVQVVGCSIRNFIVGVMITPSNQQNGELIDVIDCDISGNKVAYSMGQAQSKECHVIRLKCWEPTHTVFDNMHYGFGHGDGAGIPMVDGVNIAGHVKQLCSIYASSFSGSFRNVYAEGLFRLGFAGGKAGVSFEDCQIDFATNDRGIPYPDFFVQGSGASFHDCILRFYPGVPGARLLLSGTNNQYEGGVMNAPPVAVNINNEGIYNNPAFHQVTMYYSGGILGSSNWGPITAALPFEGSNGNGTDPVYYGNSYVFKDPFYGVDLVYKITYHDGYERTARLAGAPVLHTDKSAWTAYFKLKDPSDASLLRPGDFILTTGLHYQDDYRNLAATTYPVGIIRNIRHDTVNLDNLAYGINNGMALPLWTDYFVNEHEQMTGDLAAGSNTLVHVQGRIPAVGERLDIPMLPSGTFVTAVNTAAGTISFSNSNKTGQTFTDYTFMNGFPTVEMYSSYDLPALQHLGKTLIGGADFYQYDSGRVNSYNRDFPLNGMLMSHYKILNTNIRGDTSLHKLRYSLISRP
ncbi:MAG TPA: glycosyl hydrolase family 28-related protein [Puia sp.]|nr:glycosyl hydrolase family 28-related protein [Puia sp.]